MAKTRHGEIAKTNAMRELEVAGVAYELRTYEPDDGIPHSDLAVRTAALTGLDVEATFKTLVCHTASGSYAVFCIPAAEKLDLKKAARSAQEKNLSMLAVKELLDATGYMRGACSPVGMKKHFPTYIDETAQLFDVIGISGGRMGVTLVLDPEALADFTQATFCDLVED